MKTLVLDIENLGEKVIEVLYNSVFPTVYYLFINK